MATAGQIRFYGRLVKLTPQEVIALIKLSDQEMSSLIGQTQAKRGKKGALRK